MARNRKQPWAVGNLFLLPLQDGDSCVGQVIGREPDLLNSVAIALYEAKGDWTTPTALPALSIPMIFSALYVTRDLLDSGRWSVVGHRCELSASELTPYEDLRSRGYIGAKVRGSRNVEEFCNAFYGLAPWDDWYVADYLDDFLLTANKKPVHRLVYSGRHVRLSE